MQDGRRLKGQNREKLSWYVKRTEEKEKNCSKNKLLVTLNGGNTKTAVEEHAIRKYTFLPMI